MKYDKSELTSKINVDKKHGVVKNNELSAFSENWTKPRFFSRDITGL